MNLEALTTKYQKFAEPDGPLHGLFTVMKVAHCNFKPHPFVIGAAHVVLASDQYGGILSEKVMRQIPCVGYDVFGYRCGLSIDEHTHDTVLFLSLVRNLGNKETADALFAIKQHLLDDKIDGVTFVETPERYRIAPPEETADGPKEASQASGEAAPADRPGLSSGG